MTKKTIIIDDDGSIVIHDNTNIEVSNDGCGGCCGCITSIIFVIGVLTILKWLFGG